jgi:hypothetical protein
MLTEGSAFLPARRVQPYTLISVRTLPYRIVYNSEVANPVPRHFIPSPLIGIIGALTIIRSNAFNLKNSFSK